MSSSYGPNRWPPAPAFTTTLMSQDVYANPTDPLSVIGSGGGGSNSPPSVPPSIPSTVSAPSPSSITVNFNVSSVGGVPRPSTWAQYSVNSNGPDWTVLTSGASSNNYITAKADGLGYNNAYYFQSVASNSSGAVSSAVALYSTVATAPSPAPGVPARNGVPVSPSSISVTFVANTSGAPPPTFSTLYGTTNPPTSFWPVSLNAGTSNTYTATISSLTAGTNYYIASYAVNPIGNVSSVAGLFSTIGGASNVPPNKAPAITFNSATRSTISFNLDPTGIVGPPQPDITVAWGPTLPTTAQLLISFNNSAISTVSTYTASYTNSGVNPFNSTTNYFFNTTASNAYGVVSTPIQTYSTLSGPAPPTILNVSTIIGIGFLTYGSGGYSNALIDTSQNVAMGNWQTNGVITYPGAEPSPNGVQYLSTLQQAGNKLVVSLGGGTANPSVLSTLFGNPTSYDAGAANLANSIAYAYFKGPAALNPLGYASTAWAGFSFDGLDLDIEANTPSTTTLYVFASTLKANPGFSGKILTAAPQTPYVGTGFPSGLNANGTFTSFGVSIEGNTNLSASYVGNTGNQKAMLAPDAGQLIDYHFLQVYNNSTYTYPTSPFGNWVNVVAAWGIQALMAGNKQGSLKWPRIIFAFASTDGAPIFNYAPDSFAFNASISTANTVIRNFTVGGSNPFSFVTPGDWCAGIGFWSANSAPTVGSTPPGTSSLPVLSTLYGEPSTLNNVPTNMTMTYGGVFNSSNWGFTYGINVPIPNARGY